MNARPLLAYVRWHTIVFVLFIITDKARDKGKYINWGFGVMRDEERKLEVKASHTLRWNVIPKEREVDK